MNSGLTGGIASNMSALGLSSSTSNHALPNNIDALAGALAGHSMNATGNAVACLGGLSGTANLSSLGTATASGLHVSFATHTHTHIPEHNTRAKFG